MNPPQSCRLFDGQTIIGNPVLGKCAGEIMDAYGS